MTNSKLKRFLSWFFLAWISFNSVVMMSLMLAELSSIFGGFVGILLIGTTALGTLFLGYLSSVKDGE